MKINHFGLVNKTQQEALDFYGDFLGLEKLYEFKISPLLAREIFNLNQSIEVMVLGNEQLKLEIFIIPNWQNESPTISHLCLELPNREKYITKAKEMGIKIITAEREGRKKYFITDFNGNLFEFKEPGE